MFVPMKWLKQYVDVPMDVEEFSSRMIMTGSEVEGYEILGKGLDHVVVGRIAKLEQHPNADRLKVCTMDVGETEPLQIITGADNVFEGALVPAALVGANLPCGLKIKASKLRGLPSVGMLCSGEELCITDAVYPGAEVDGILILQEEYAPGTPIAEVLGMNDTIVEFKTLSNRPDCMSMIGVAREASATLGSPLRMPAMKQVAGTGDIHDFLQVEVRDPELCPRYMSRMVRNVKIGPSPKWMKDALTAAGMRSINNIVDITNYVMLELGQPMHAFDYRHVDGGKIVVRHAAPGEKMTLLDDKEITLTQDMLVIAGETVPTALAGIMGGGNSGIEPDTQDILFESANFNAYNVRITSRALGVRTESSARFEKRLDANLAQMAMDRAMTLVEELGCGEVVGGCIDICHADLAPKTLDVSTAAVNRLLGQQLTGETMAEILEKLMIHTRVEGDILHCDIPSWRGDLGCAADIAEEVQRIYGYDTIPSELLSGSMNQGGLTQEQKDSARIKDILAGMGFYEGMTYSFMSPQTFGKLLLPQDSPLRNAVRIMNPLGEEYSLMRTTLIPGLLQSAGNNLSQRIDTVRLFEMGRTFHPKQMPMTELPQEVNRLGMVIVDKRADFFTLKGMVEKLLEAFRVPDVHFAAGGGSYLHPGRKAMVTAGGDWLGELGELHPDTQAAYELGSRVLVAEIDVDALLAHQGPATVFHMLPRFPAVHRDVALLVDAQQPVGPMIDAMYKAAGSLLTEVSLFDVYQGQQVPPGKKSVAFALTFRCDERTLTDEDVEKLMEKVLVAMASDYAAVLRS